MQTKSLVVGTTAVLTLISFAVAYFFGTTMRAMQARTAIPVGRA
jgi:hypothetical protein